MYLLHPWWKSFNLWFHLLKCHQLRIHDNLHLLENNNKNLKNHNNNNLPSDYDDYYFHTFLDDAKRDSSMEILNIVKTFIGW